jgi:hypothetical protein
MKTERDNKRITGICLHHPAVRFNCEKKEDVYDSS